MCVGWGSMPSIHYYYNSNRLLLASLFSTMNLCTIIFFYHHYRHSRNSTIGWCVTLGPPLSFFLKVFAVLFSGTDWLKGQDALSVISREAFFYSRVDKIRSPRLRLTPIERHPFIFRLSVRVHNTCISVSGSVFAFAVAIVLHTHTHIMEFKKHRFIRKPQSFRWLTDCLLHVSLRQSFLE